MTVLYTHSDFDGLISAVLISRIFKPSDIVVAEPRELRGDLLDIKPEDIVIDLPRPEVDVRLWCDHHGSEGDKPIITDSIKYVPAAKSCASIIYNHFKDKLSDCPYCEEAVKWANKIDSADFTLEEYKTHNEYSVISMSLKSFDKELDKYYIRWLIKKILDTGSFKHVSMLDPVNIRYDYKTDSIERWKYIIKVYLKYENDIIITDTRKSNGMLPKGNNYALFEMYPDARVTIGISRFGPDKCYIGAGENIFNKGQNKVDIGKLMKKYKGGGHFSVGGCEVPVEGADKIFNEILNILKENKG